MSRKPETTLIAGVNKFLPAGVHCEKTNNPYRKGMADVWYSAFPCDLWVEYKWLPRIPKKPFLADLSVLQLNWLRDRYNEGRNVAVIVGCPNGVIILRNLSWEQPTTFDDLKTRREAAEWIAKETIYASVTRPHSSSESNIPNIQASGDNDTNWTPSVRSRSSNKEKTR